MCAGKHKLENLTVLVDYNKLQSYGETSIVQDLEPLVDKWRSFNFNVSQVDGHDVGALGSVLASSPLEAAKPSAIICHTVKGKGIAIAEHEPTWHHKSNLDADQIDSLLEGLGGRHAQDLSE